MNKALCTLLCVALAAGGLFSTPALAHEVIYADPHRPVYDCYYDDYGDRICYERRYEYNHYHAYSGDIITGAIVGLGLGLALQHGYRHPSRHRGHGQYKYYGDHHRGHGRDGRHRSRGWRH